MRSRRYGAYELHASVREAPTPGAVARCNDDSCDDDTEDDDDTHEFSHVIILCVVWFTRLPCLVIASLVEITSFVEWKLSNISGRQAPVTCVPTGTGRTPSAVSETSFGVNAICASTIKIRCRVRARRVVARTTVAELGAIEVITGA